MEREVKLNVRVVSFVMVPGNLCQGTWTYEGALKALDKLSERYAVKAEFYKGLGNLGFGLEEEYILTGNRDDITCLIDDFEEWARQFSKYFITGTSEIAR